jgi:hypothetical protein
VEDLLGKGREEGLDIGEPGSQEARKPGSHAYSEASFVELFSAVKPGRNPLSSVLAVR